MNRFSILILTSLTFILAPLSLEADDAETLRQIEEQLAKVKTFEFGQDGAPIQNLEQTLFRIPANSSLRESAELKLIEALKDANNTGRGVICRQLRAIGTDRCIPAVKKLLHDEQLSPFARYALEGIGTDAALRAMHEAMRGASVEVQVGLLGSLAAHRYEPVRVECNQLIYSENPHVANAAIRTLGRLGGTNTISELIRLRSDGSPSVDEIDLALLECLKHLPRDNSEMAFRIYSMFYELDGAPRMAGLQGMLEAKPEQSVGILVHAMNDDDPNLSRLAIRLSAYSRDRSATTKFLEILEQLAPDKQALLVKALGIRGDLAAVPRIIQASQSENREIQVAAIESLGGLSGAEAVDRLLLVATGDDASLAGVARASLRRMNDADDHLVEKAQSEDTSKAVEAVRALTSRQAKGAIELFAKLAGTEEPEIRQSAIEALGSVGDESSLHVLLSLVLKPASPEDLKSLESALRRALLRIDSPADRAEPVLEVLEDASSEVRPALIRQLSLSGSDLALNAVRHALRSGDDTIANAAVQSLSSWPNADAADDLIEVFQSQGNEEQKSIALDGYVRIASASDEPTELFLKLLSHVDDVNDKKRVLNEIGLNCESFEAIRTTQSLYSDPQLNAVAAIATVRIAYKLRQQHKEEVRAILEDVLARVDHPDVNKRAQDVLNDLDKYEEHIMEWVYNGPYVDEDILSGEQNYRTIFPPESSDDEELEWKPLELGINTWDINLESTFGAIDHCSVYVRTMIWSPVDQDVQVEGGCDDALKIWVNGELVFDDYRTRGGSPRTMLAPATLKEGWNELMLKAVDHEGGWQFGCRVRRPNGTRLEGLKYEAK